MNIVYIATILILMLMAYIYRTLWQEEKTNRKRLEEILNSIYTGYQYKRGG